ncbi:uncharacterized protein LOC118434606 [Folsomia candida]|uniref:uncharacterized protein LOC118434606 n=1 Tax=Folsomia candida TaxID=158441 RepID=UPI001604AD45|nr:uncharacterized protein LOC118434606 [Folsomia candida]
MIMDWKKKFCSTSLNLRLALDVLQIISCNIIHFAMEGTGFYLQEDSTSYRIGEFIWYVMINTLGFLAQIIVLVKVSGCKLSPHFMRVYYITSFLLLIFISTVIISITYAGLPSPECTPSTPPDQRQNCKSNTSKGEMSSSKFGFEFTMFILTALTGCLYLYSFTLTFCKIKPDIGISAIPANPNDSCEHEQSPLPVPSENSSHNDNANLTDKDPSFSNNSTIAVDHN